MKVDPVNDQPFKLVTRPAVLPVVQSMSTVLTPENLLTVDDDTSPEEIHYEIVDGPKLGTLTVNKDVNHESITDVQLGQRTSRIEYRDFAHQSNTLTNYRSKNSMNKVSAKKFLYEL